MVEIHRLLVRDELEKLYKLFSASQPPGIFTKLISDVCGFLNEMKTKEESDLKDLYNNGHRHFQKETVGKILDSTGANPDNPVHGGDSTS